MACEDVVFVQVRGATEQTPSEAPKNNDLLLNEVRTTRAYVSVARTVCQHEPGCLPIASEETRGLFLSQQSNVAAFRKPCKWGRICNGVPIPPNLRMMFSVPQLAPATGPGSRTSRAHASQSNHRAHQVRNCKLLHGKSPKSPVSHVMKYLSPSCLSLV